MCRRIRLRPYHASASWQCGKFQRGARCNFRFAWGNVILSTVLHFVGHNLRSTCSLSRTTKISLSLFKSWRKPWKKSIMCINVAVVGLSGMSVDRFDVTWSRCLLSFAHYQYHQPHYHTSNINTHRHYHLHYHHHYHHNNALKRPIYRKNYVCTNSRLFAPSMSPRAIASLPRNISCLEIPDDHRMPNYELVLCPFSY